MTTETWTKVLKGSSAGLCGSTLQSSRRGREAANPDQALEQIGLRIAALVVAEDERQRACGEKGAECPLHRRPGAEMRGAPADPEPGNRAEPAAEHAGEDIERPVHADPGPRQRHQRGHADD